MLRRKVLDTLPLQLQLRRRVSLSAHRQRARRRLRLLRGAVRAGAARTLRCYCGTVWIDKKTFARVRVRRCRAALAGPVVSNEETQHYTPIAVGNRPSCFLFSGLTARQIF